MKLAKTLGELKESGYRPVSTKEEMRRNLLELIKGGQKRFPGIIGYDRTVLPQLENAILSRHDFILLGLRGQAKTRILRQLTDFLNEHIPIIKGSILNENPLAAISAKYKKLVGEAGDELEIEWLHREERYHEKLATPDVSVADLIGDIDPIKAVRDKLDLSDEEVIHWGIIPRTNRGIFAINELPDLQPRIQVALLNILEENDIESPLPEDLSNLVKKALNVRNHLEDNHKDLEGKKGLQRTESKIYRLIKYYKKKNVLAQDFKYDPEKIRTLVAR